MQVWEDHCLQVAVAIRGAFRPSAFAELAVDGRQRLCPVTQVLREGGKGEVQPQRRALHKAPHNVAVVAGNVGEGQPPHRHVLAEGDVGAYTASAAAGIGAAAAAGGGVD